MKPWQAFLLGEKNSRGLDLNWIFTASDQDLEDRHDWIQWAFPTDTPSQFNSDAPVVTREEMQALSEAQRESISHCFRRYVSMLQANDWWRRPNDHNHLRITRVIRCLTLMGGPDAALAKHLIVVAKDIGQPNAVTLRYWSEATQL